MWYINPMDQFSFKTISVVREVEHGDHVYRYDTKFGGKTTVRRVPKTDRLWGHGTICEMFSCSGHKFKPMILIDHLTERVDFRSFERAVFITTGVTIDV